MKKILFILITLLCLNTQNTSATTVTIDLHAGYKAFYPNSTIRNGFILIYLGDTVKFVRGYFDQNETRPDFLFHTIDLDLNQSPINATPFSYPWDNRTDIEVKYVPNLLGKYYFYCGNHSTMTVKIQVLPQDNPTCTGLNIEGTACLSFSGCSTCFGVVYNCNCMDPANVPIITCTGLGIEGSSCVGSNVCSTCVGVVQNCSCIGQNVSPVPSTLVSGFSRRTEIEPKIFPNPAEDELQFTLDPYRKYIIEVYDVEGELVIQGGANKVSQQSLSIKHLKNGNYFVKVFYCACATPKVDCSKAIKTLKFIKK